MGWDRIQCSVSECWIERAVFRSALFGERPSTECLYGLGELLAHSPGSRHPHVRYLHRLNSSELGEWLSAASALAHSHIKPAVVRPIGAQHLLSETDVSAPSLANARAFLLRGPAHPLFGLSIIAESLLRSHPQAMVTWLTQNPDPEVADSVLGYLCERLLFQKGRDAVHVGLLRTGNPFLQMLTGAALCGSEASSRLSFTDMYEFANSVGVSPTRAFMVALTATDYMMSAGPLTDTQKHSLATAMAASWPGAPFNDMEWNTLQQALHPRWVELGVRLAHCLGPQHNPAPLLDRVLATVANIFGYKQPEKYLKERPEVTPENLEDHLTWASRAFALRYRADSKGVGKQAGQQLHHLCEPALRLISQPYALARFPHASYALERYAGVLLLALRIARGDSDKDRSERHKLMKGSLAEARALLYIATDYPNRDRLLEELARVCVSYMCDFAEMDNRVQWFEDPRLPAFTRALALWSDPAATRQHACLALKLLQELTQPGPARRQETILRRANLVTDFALAALFDAQAKDLVKQFLSQWQQMLGLWQGLEVMPVSRLPHRIYLALRKPGRHRRWLMSDPEWSHSRCAARI